MASETGELFSFHNVGLFSDHFLSKRLPAESLLWTSEKIAAQTAFDKIFAQYKKFKATYEHPNEAQTEDDFIRPVLNILGYSYIVQTPLKHKGQFNQPDYSLFADEKTKKEAGSFRVKEQEAFYGKALAICDAKYWGRPLDIKLSDTKDSFTNINPSFQIVNYLVGANVDWGILTNGKLWRLYYQKATSRSSNFYEVDLEDLILKAELEAFLYFFLFFRKETFLKDLHGKTFLDYVLEGSTSYAAEVSDVLKEKVFTDIFPHLARGFLHYRRKELGIQTETGETLKEIYNATLTLLYRLLFILYAEARDLLPVGEDAYRHYSLANVKQKVADLRDKKATLSELSTHLWNDLDTLFKIVDTGDPKLNVPTYNGGLFSQKNPKNDFLKTNKVPDPWLAEALDHLTREVDKETGKPQFIDYSELEVRHLGSIYEGLLEFRLRIADEDKALVKERGREIYKPLADVKNPGEVIKKGELYLENDKHERKSTGSYYTPDYIAKYIVQNAVGPVLEEKLKTVQRLFSDVESLETKARRATISGAAITDRLKTKKQEAVNELFSLKVLDPAMGSGHFLVETVDFLSDHIIKFLNDHPENPVLEEIENLRSTILSDLKKKGIQIDQQKLTPTNLVKRMVMKRCIYGVDLNPMAVELAKLSLWLHSFTLGAPLSFLDHHLKCGNSLIGTTVKKVKGSMEEVRVGEEGRYVDWEGREKIVPEQKALYLFGSQFAGLLSATELMRQVGELTDSTFEEVQESQQKYEKASDALKPFKLILDLWTSEYFGNKDAQRFLTHGGDVQAFLKGNGRLPPQIKKFRQETENLSHSKQFFHWELEFPEVFYEGSREKEKPGFDAVIGNPPFGANLDKMQELYLENRYGLSTGKVESYIYFLLGGATITCTEGFLALLTPNVWLTLRSLSHVRRRLLSDFKLVEITEALSAFEAWVNTLVVVARKTPPKEPYEVQVRRQRVAVDGRVDLLKPNYWPISYTISSSYWDNPLTQIPYVVPPTAMQILRKLGEMPANALEFLEGTTGFQVYHNTMHTEEQIKSRFLHSQTPKDDTYRRYISGTDISRYFWEFSRQDYVRYGDHLYRTPEERFFLQPRLMIQEIAGRGWKKVEATFEQGPVYSDNTTLILTHRSGISFPGLKALLCVYNSRLFTWFLLNSSDKSYASGDFSRLNVHDFLKIPVPWKAPTTREKGRILSLEKGKALYERCLVKTDFLCVTGFVDHCLKQKPEQADVVHDLLVFLAERTMEMNKEKQAETKGFLEWLEATIGAKVDSLRNKTKIRAYHEGSLENLLEILKENSKVLTVKPASKDFYDVLKNAFQKSMSKLSPLKNKIATTDHLIDLVVYRLYGLTEEEIRIVEGG
jgi:type I restriction-modification system DNA methylase subunit